MCIQNVYETTDNKKSDTPSQRMFILLELTGTKASYKYFWGRQRFLTMVPNKGTLAKAINSFKDHFQFFFPM